MTGSRFDETAADLRRAFDESFALPAHTERPEREELLAFRAGDRALALRTRDIAGLQRCPPLRSVPSRNPALIGLAGVRGTLVAVYDLAVLVGDEPTARGCAWIVQCAADRSVALGFGELTRYAAVPTTCIHVAEPPRSAPASSDGDEGRAILRLDEGDHAIIHVARLLDDLRRTAHVGTHREP